MNFTSSSQSNSLLSDVNLYCIDKQDEDKINCEIKCCNCEEVLALHKSLKDNDTSKIMEYSSINNSKLSFIQGNTVTMIAKSDSPFHVPMCNDCHLVLVEDLRLKNNILDEQNKGYRRCLTKITSSENEIKEEELEKTIKLKKLQEKERTLQQELKKLEDEERELESDIKKLEEKEGQLQGVEKKLISTLKVHHGDMVNFSLKKLSLKLQETFAIEQLNELRKVNMLNKTFYIYVNNKEIGCINDLRLGRLPDQSIPLNEFNAAWGLNQYPYQLIPMGSQSIIREYISTGVKDYKLYESSWTIFKAYMDDAISVYVKCLQKFDSEFCQQNNIVSGTIFPYTIRNDKIAEEVVNASNEASAIWYSIKTQFQKDERWTKAMKLMLLNLKNAIIKKLQIVKLQGDANKVHSNIGSFHHAASIALLLSGSMYTHDNYKYNNENIFSKHLPFLKDKFFLKSQLPFIEINNNQPIRINALVIDNNFDPDVVFGSKRGELYKKGFSTTGDENSQNTPSNSLEISNNRKSPSPDIDINFKHQYDKSDQANFGRKSPFSDTQSLDDYIDEALNNGDFDIDKFACNDKDMCDNLFSSLDEVERNQYQSFDQFPRENEQFLTSEFEIIAREMENDPLDPLSSHFDPYMYDMKMTPKKIDISKGYDRRKGQSSSESQSLFGSKKILTNRVVRKESSVPVDIPGDMSLRPELAKGINYHQYRRPSSTDNELYGNELSNGRKKSGRVSKDKELLIENRISITPSELRDFSLKEFKLFLDNNGLSEEQKILCRNIRRRGRNKIAAKKVRTNRYSRSKNSDDSTSETFSISPTLFLNDPEPTPPRFVKKSQGFTYPDFEFSDDIFENTDPLYEIRDVQE